MSAYIGFDPTASSLHVGSRLPILALARLYETTLRWALKHRLIASFFGFLAFVGAIVSAMALPAGFIPTEDPGYIMFNISAPPGSTPSAPRAGSGSPQRSCAGR